MKRILVWTCPECKEEVTSYSWRRHDMNYCGCKKTACDFEEHYTRWVTNNSLSDLKIEQYILKDSLSKEKDEDE